MRFKKRYFFALLGLAMAMVSPNPVSADSHVKAPNIKIVASGLDSPRGIGFYGSRAVVAESGHGSDSASGCFAPPGAPPGFQICIGNTSQISWVNTRTGSHTPLATGFFSISIGGQETIGVSGISVRGGKIYAQIGATSREAPPNIPIAQQAGDLIVVNPSNGAWKKIADVGDKDFDFTTQFPLPDPATCGQCPGTNEHDANPTSVLATENGWLVADSGANTLTKVSKKGKTSIVHYFPWRDPNPSNFPSDDVPTCVTSADDTLWVGTLAGHLYRIHGANATEVIPRNSSGTPLLTHVTGCTAGRSGSLYLVNMFGAGNPGVDATAINGSVVKYNPESKKASVLGDAMSNPALFLPYSPAIGPDGNLYVTAGAVCDTSGANPFGPGAGPNPCTIGAAKGGRVVRIKLSNEEHG
jgi:hypothetical protein